MFIWYNQKVHKVIDTITLPEVGFCYKTKNGIIPKSLARVMSDESSQWWETSK